MKKIIIILFLFAGIISCKKENFYSGGYIFVPSAFSPNGDGNNDTLFARFDTTNLATFPLTFNMKIFEKGGNKKLFEQSDLKKGWDGKYNGKILPEGPYKCMVKYSNIDGDFWANTTVEIVY